MNHSVEWVKNDHLGEQYAKVVHPSGLTVLVCPKKMSTSYALFATKYGSLERTFRKGDEPFVTVPDGIAHFLEHKLFEEEDGSMMIDLAGDYYGQLDYQMEYKGMLGEPFDWLYLDFSTLNAAAEEHGFKAGLLAEGDHYDYLVRLTVSRPDA